MVAKTEAMFNKVYAYLEWKYFDTSIMQGFIWDNIVKMGEYGCTYTFIDIFWMPKINMRGGKDDRDFPPFPHLMKQFY